MTNDARTIAEQEREIKRLRKLLTDNGISPAKQPARNPNPRRYAMRSTYNGGSRA